MNAEIKRNLSEQGFSDQDLQAIFNFVLTEVQAGAEEVNAVSVIENGEEVIKVTLK